MNNESNSKHIILIIDQTLCHMLINIKLYKIIMKDTAIHGLETIFFVWLIIYINAK